MKILIINHISDDHDGRDVPHDVHRGAHADYGVHDVPRDDYDVLRDEWVLD